MKFETTKKAVMNGYYKVIAIGYCNAQHLLRYIDPVAYTVRAEGWGADVYQIGSVAIVTGYAPFGTVRPGYDTVREFDKRAEAITSASNFDYKAAKEQVDAIVAEFVQHVTE